MPLYQLTINEDQARLMARALDLLSRIRAGQLRALEDELDVDDFSRRDAVRTQIEYLRLAAGFPSNDNFSRPGCREAFNLRKVLEHAVSWDTNPPKPGGFQTVNYDGPLSHWWESGHAAAMLKFEGDEAVRIRDQVNRTRFLGRELAELIGTEDIDEATKRIKAWKRRAEG